MKEPLGLETAVFDRRFDAGPRVSRLTDVGSVEAQFFGFVEEFSDALSVGAVPAIIIYPGFFDGVSGMEIGEMVIFGKLVFVFIELEFSAELLVKAEILIFERVFLLQEG